MTEFALVLPVLLLILLFGIDFGRVFLGWINLNNVAKVAANYAAMNPTASWGAGTEYQTLIANDMAGINCTTTTPYPAPTFPGGFVPGNNVRVTIGCKFKLLTPFLDIIISDPVDVTASSAFPIRSGILPGVPLQTVVPGSPIPSTSATASASASVDPSVDPSAAASASASAQASASASAIASASASAVANCTVPDFKNTDTSGAQALWASRGFTTNVLFSPLVGANYTIRDQSLTKNTDWPCLTTVITVYATNQPGH